MHKRMNTSFRLASRSASGLAFGLTPALAIGTLLLVTGGCESQSTRSGDGRGGVGEVEPVNTGLNVLGSESEVQLPEDPWMTDREPGMAVTDQIAESARQLNAYFDQLENADGEQGDEINKIEEPGESAGMPDFQLEAELARKLGVEPTHEQSADQPSETVPAGQQISDPVAEENPTEEGLDHAKAEPADGDGVRVSLTGSGGSVEMGDEDEGDRVANPQERKRELARELGQILSELANTSDDPGAAALAMAGLEMVLPGDTELLVDEGVLSESERASLDAARSFLKTMSSQGSIASPSEVAAGLAQIQAKLDQWAGLSISKAALCTDVYGFGRYETFSSYRFIAGKAQRMVVYIELERFGQREYLGPDGQARFESKLSQRIELYHAADDLNAWNQPAETVSDVTRNRLRDYYLTRMVTLPANLGVGRYHLKVVVRDLIGERGAETIIPIEVVSR